MKRLYLKAIYYDMTFLGEYSDILNVEYKDSQLRVFNRDENFAVIGLEHSYGEVSFKKNPLKISNHMSKFEVKGYDKGNITITTKRSSRWCEALTYNLFINNKRKGCFIETSRVFSLEKNYILIFKDGIDIDFLAMIMVYLHDALNDSSS